jgi:hypothetical protein
MKNTLADSPKMKLRKMKIGILSVVILFLGGIAFSISKLAAAPETNPLIAEKTIKGIVFSTDKNPIPGAIILVKGTTTGTATDIGGNFSLDLKYFEEESLTLKISMINYESTEVVVDMNKLPRDLGKISLKKEAK